MLYDLGIWGLIVTAPGDEGYDFISRFFAPAKGVPEDPVTGSAHCALTPYWAKRLGKATLKARQVSPRGGDLLCTDDGLRTILEGPCALYLTGEIEIELDAGGKPALPRRAFRRVAQRRVFRVDALGRVGIVDNAFVEHRQSVFQIIAQQGKA